MSHNRRSPVGPRTPHRWQKSGPRVSARRASCRCRYLPVGPGAPAPAHVGSPRTAHFTYPEVLWILSVRSGPESSVFGEPKRPVLSQKHAGQSGGQAPHPFPRVCLAGRAASTAQVPARFMHEVRHLLVWVGPYSQTYSRLITLLVHRVGQQESPLHVGCPAKAFAG